MLSLLLLYFGFFLSPKKKMEEYIAAKMNESVTISYKHSHIDTKLLRLFYTCLGWE